MLLQDATKGMGDLLLPWQPRDPFITLNHRKGDLENAVQSLELYVGVAEKAGLTKPLAKACSAAGIMFNTLVSGGDPGLIEDNNY